MVAADASAGAVGASVGSSDAHDTNFGAPDAARHQLRKKGGAPGQNPENTRTPDAPTPGFPELVLSRRGASGGSSRTAKARADSCRARVRERARATATAAAAQFPGRGSVRVPPHDTNCGAPAAARHQLRKNGGAPGQNPGNTRTPDAPTPGFPGLVLPGRGASGRSSRTAKARADSPRARVRERARATATAAAAQFPGRAPVPTPPHDTNSGKTVARPAKTPETRGHRMPQPQVFLSECCQAAACARAN